MPGTNEFVWFATGGGANVEDTADYLADPTTLGGFASGIAQSIKLNKAWRQATAASAMLGQFIADQGGNAFDDGVVAHLESAFEAALLSYLSSSLGAANGQCILVLNGANLQLKPYNGNNINVNGSQQAIPSGGVFCAPTGLTPGTAYYIYCALFSTNVTGTANNGTGLIRLTVGSTAGLVTGDTETVSGIAGTTEANGVWPVTVVDSTHIDLQGSTFSHAYTSGGTVTGLQLLTSTTGHVTNPVNGIEVKSGDATQTLVGFWLVSSGPAWSTVSIQGLSWFNRQKNGNRTKFSVDRSTISESTSLVEINTEIRNSFLVWAGEVVEWRLNGEISISGGTSGASGGVSGVAFDGLVPEPSIAIVQEPATGVTNGTTGAVADFKAGLSEGLHYATIVGGGIQTGTGTPTMTWYANNSFGAASITTPAQLTVIVEG